MLMAINAKANDLAWAATLAAAWFWTCRQLSMTWSAYPNYGFGYCVPWIALLLAWRRIGAMPGSLQRAPSALSPHGAPRFLLGAVLALAWALFLFAELVRQIDPHWRMVSWVMMASVTLLTGGALWHRGGGELLKLLAFPLAFAWTAIPWPLGLENAVTLNLQAFVTSASVSALHLMGIGAAHQGNIIHLATGSVVVDSACSGITSLQSTLMAALFLGEFFRFRAGHRIFLVASGACIAMAANLARATTLVWLADRGGPDRLAAYHDPAGYAETAGIFLALAALAWLLSRKRGAHPPETADPRAGASETASPRERIASVSLWARNDGFTAFAAFTSIPLLACGWFAFTQRGAIRTQQTARWTLKANDSGAGTTAWRAQSMSLSTSDLRMLACTEEQTISLEGPGPANAEVHHFFWKTNSGAAFDHNPENCMKGSGWEKKGGPDVVSLRIKDAEFPCNVYRYARDGEEVVVFQSLWYGGDPALSHDDFPYTVEAPRASRLALLWSGPRRQGLESLNIYVPPTGDLAAQTHMAEAVLDQVLVPNH